MSEREIEVLRCLLSAYPRAFAAIVAGVWK